MVNVAALATSPPLKKSHPWVDPRLWKSLGPSALGCFFPYEEERLSERTNIDKAVI